MSTILEFLQNRIWCHLPDTVSRRTRLLAAVLWSGALLILGLKIWHNRIKAGIDPGAKPVVIIILGMMIGLILCAPGVGTTFYFWVLRFFAVIGFFLSLIVLTLGFYLIVTPMGLIMRWTGKDFLRTSARSKPEWIPHPGPPDRKRFYRLF